MPVLDLNKLHQFCVLARAGSYVRAAEELHFSQSALTRNMQALEHWQGARLIERERGRKGVVLTEAGQHLLAHAQELLRRAEEIEADLRVGESITRPRVSFGMGPMLASVLMPKVLAPAVSSEDRMLMHAIIASPEVMMERLLAGELDFYFGQDPGPARMHPRVHQELAAMAHATLWVRAGHPLLERSNPTLTDLQGFPLASGEAWNERVLPLLPDERLQQKLETNVQLDNFNVLSAMVRNSDAILISMYDDDSLEHLPVSLPTPPMPLYFFTLRGISLSPLAARTLAAVRSRLEVLTGPPSSGTRNV